MIDKVSQLILRLQDPLAWCKSELEDFLGEEKHNSSMYIDLIHAMNIINELEKEVEKLKEEKVSSKKFKQQKLFT